MKRVVEKVKDIVEVRPFAHLSDFSADPALTLSSYHFTDITADLMAKWIDRIASVRPGSGTALALAGFRGVGKSHFLATIAAALARPELRSRISDPHVTASAERLPRRASPIAFVRRGTSDSLFDELKREISRSLGIHLSELSDSVYDVLLKASEKAAEMPLVLLFDTAAGRENRVSRDDGATLGEIAEASKALGIFVGAALDDDIAGADGPNFAISGSFAIDYLDQEHLYKIVDTHIFTKHSQKLGVLHDIYDNYRTVLPAFRWSEQRFAALYPLHPATVEIAPLIRLFIQDFALLGFASEAGVKILGRPANSLIGLDEVFDNIESRLRNVADLEGMFAAYDSIEREVIAKSPVGVRLPAKIILKGLLLLSLDGKGASADEIAAAMMMFSDDGSLDIYKILHSFTEALPDAISTSNSKFCLKTAGEDKIESLLETIAPTVTDESIWGVLLQQTAEKFIDFGDFAPGGPKYSVTTVEWRGGIRRGQIFWDGKTGGDRHTDWTISVVRQGSDQTPTAGKLFHSVEWRVGELTAEERTIVQRAFLLQTDANVREIAASSLATAVHLSSIAVEKVWNRVFLTDALFVAGDETIALNAADSAAHSLSQLVTAALTPLFEREFPSHPSFGWTLDHKHESALISGFISGAEAAASEAQTMAEAFAFPLGLAVRQPDGFHPAASEDLRALPLVKALDDFPADGTAALADIYQRLQSAPFGLTREAQHIVLASLVAARLFEFVTSKGNRINHRSLDLQIVWEDIVGLAKPVGGLFSPERLLTWAKLLTGNAALKSIDRTEDRLLAIDSLSNWLQGWKDSRILTDFDALPDENLNAAIWRTAANLRKTFGTMAEHIESLVADETSLDQCVNSIAELFSDSEPEFENKKSDMRVLRDYIAGVSRRGEISRYLAACEATTDPAVEDAKLALLTAVTSRFVASEAAAIGEIETLWKNFAALYAGHYVERHDAVMNVQISGDKLREIVRSAEWAVFESLAAMPWLDQRFAEHSRRLIREIRQLYCTSNVRMSLESRPFCTCSYSLVNHQRLAGLPGHLSSLITQGIASFRQQLVAGRTDLIASAESDAMRSSVTQILDRISENNGFDAVTTQDFRILKIVSTHALEIHPAEKIIDLDAESESISDMPATAIWTQEIAEVEAFVNQN